MTKKASIIELRKMLVPDLRSEIRMQEKTVSKLRLGVKMQKEKDTAKYVHEKKQLARMRTILTEKQTEALHAEEGERRVRSPKKAVQARPPSAPGGSRPARVSVSPRTTS